MNIDTAFWRDLAAKSRKLSNLNAGLKALRHDGGQWSVYGGPDGKAQRERLHREFLHFARTAAIAAGVPNRAKALDAWLELLRTETIHFQAMQNGIEPAGVGGYIFNVAAVSAEYCDELAGRTFELEATATDGVGRTGLRPDRYPFHYWLYDHSHEPAVDPKTEFDYWKAHVWRGFHVLIEDLERLGIKSGTIRREKLDFAIGSLTYDLAVLQANYAIDRRLRGEDAVRAFQAEVAELMEEVTSSWRASCERLAVTLGDETEEVRSLAQPFHRVRDDLRRLLHSLPSNASPGTGSLPKSGTLAPPGRAKRGRPQIIPDTWKAEAVALKASGGSNKDAAAKLYGCKYPSAQQVRNVPSILRHYRAAVEKKASPRVVS
jgi:hypothetical protein